MRHANSQARAWYRSAWQAAFAAPSRGPHEIFNGLRREKWNVGAIQRSGRTFGDGGLGAKLDEIGMAKRFILVLALLTSGVGAALVNPPGGAYIQCDPRNPSSPVRCSVDGW